MCLLMSVPVCRALDDVTQSPSRGDNNSSSLGHSASTSSPRAASAVLLPGLESLPVRSDTLLPTSYHSLVGLDITTRLYIRIRKKKNL